MPRAEADARALFGEDKQKKDRYNGVSIELDSAECRQVDAESFSFELEAALDGWRRAGVKGVWLKVPEDLHRFISPAIELGMTLHHARGSYLMLNHWLPEGSSRLPEAVHHQVGVGGLVICPNGTHVLVIREKTGVTANMRDFWKLPGGLVDRGEDIWQATEREVFEETGIRAQFRALAGFREHHMALFENTDFYMVSVLQLDPDEYPDAIAGGPLPKPRPCELEIADAKWMPLDDWIKLPMYRRPGLYRDLLHTCIEVAHRVHREDYSMGLYHDSSPDSRHRDSLYKAASKL